MPAVARSPMAAVMAVAVCVVGLAFAVLGATAGPGTVLESGRRDPPTAQAPTSEAARPSAEQPRGRDGERDERRRPAPDWFVAIFGPLEVVALVLLALVLVERLTRLRRRRRRHRRRLDDFPLGGELGELGEPLRADDVVEEIVADAAEQMALLESGAPRNGIVACWHRFEVHAARAGVPREEWETSTEFTTRLLGLVEADVDGVSTLAALYKEARFSDHEVGEDERSAALTALERIHTRLVRP